MTGTDGYHDNPGIADAVDFLYDRKSMDYLCDRHKENPDDIFSSEPPPAQGKEYEPVRSQGGCGE